MNNMMNNNSSPQPEKKFIPQDWRCPITGQIMFDPVLVHISNQSYEREALEYWLKSKNTDPQTNQIIPKNGYSSNQALRNTIYGFASQTPSMWTDPDPEDCIYLSEKLKKNIWDAVTGGNEKELSRLLELDPRMIYELKDKTTLLEFSGTAKNRMPCIVRIIGHAETNPLGGLAKLKEVTTNSEKLLFNLAKENAIEFINLLSKVYGWEQSIYEDYFFKTCEKGWMELLPAFKNLKIRFDLALPDGTTGLHLAVSKNHQALVSMLLSDLRTTLTNEGLFQFLLLKAGPSAAIGSGKTFFDIAFDQKNQALLQEIRKILRANNNNNQIVNISLPVTASISDKEYAWFVYAVNQGQFNDNLSLVMGWNDLFYQYAAKKRAIIFKKRTITSGIISGSLNAPLEIQKDLISFLKVCIQQGAKINHQYQEENGRTLLHLAISNSGYMQFDNILDAILELNPDVNQQDNSGKTPLHEAVLTRKIPCIKILCANKNIDPWIADNTEKIALEYTLTNNFGKKELLSLLGSFHSDNPIKLFGYLLEKYEVNGSLRDDFQSLGWDRNFYQQCAFDFAKTGKTLLLKACLELGVDPNARDKTLDAPYLLFAAIAGGELSCVTILLDKADIGVRTRVEGNTLLHEAVRHKKQDIAFVLLERGLGVSNRKGQAENKAQQTAEEYAESLGYSELANAIKQRRGELKYKPFLEPLKSKNEALEREMEKCWQELNAIKEQKQKIAPLFQLFKAQKNTQKNIDIGSHSDGIYTLLSLPLSPQYLMTGSKDKTIKVWDISKNLCIATLKDHTSSIFRLISLQQGKYVASASADESIKIWDVSDPTAIQCIKTLTGHDSFVDAIAELPNEHLVSVSRDKIIKIWDLRDINPALWSCVTTLSNNVCTERVIAFPVKNNRYCFGTGLNSGDISIWDATDPKNLNRVTQLKGHISLIRDMLFWQDNLITASGDKSIKIWKIDNFTSCPCIATLIGHTNEVTALALLSPRYLASGSADKTIKIWDLQTHTCITTLQGHTEAVWALAFSPDGHLVSAESNDNNSATKSSIKLWSNFSSSLIEKIEETVPECKMM